MTCCSKLGRIPVSEGGKSFKEATVKSIVRHMFGAMHVYGGTNQIQLEQTRATGELETKFEEVINHVAALHRANQTNDDDENGFLNEGAVARCKQR